ncbi:MAG: bifunctional precorrin-2 dehydrogenase/sirohydrochlorin ferrochelatase [Bacillus sp. (in: firmicutes)]
MQPLIIDLKGRSVVIAGGGRIAARKARVLGGQQAAITFIAPQFSDEVLTLAEEHGYRLIERKAEAADFAEALLVVLATNDSEANRALREVLPAHQLVCVVDEANSGNVLFPATVRRGNLQIAVTSSGASPKLTRKLKKELEQQFDASWIAYSSFLGNARELVLRSDLTFEQKQEILLEILDDRYRFNELLCDEKLLKLEKLDHKIEKK